MGSSARQQARGALSVPGCVPCPAAVGSSGCWLLRTGPWWGVRTHSLAKAPHARTHTHTDDTHTHTRQHTLHASHDLLLCIAHGLLCIAHGLLCIAHGLLCIAHVTEASTCAHIHIYAHIQAYTHLKAHEHVSKHVHVRTITHVCACTLPCTSTHVHTQACTHTHTHKHKHASTCTHAPWAPSMTSRRLSCVAAWWACESWSSWLCRLAPPLCVLRALEHKVHVGRSHGLEALQGSPVQWARLGIAGECACRKAETQSIWHRACCGHRLHTPFRVMGLTTTKHRDCACRKVGAQRLCVCVRMCVCV